MIEKVDISQADYNALEVKDPNTVYCIPPEKVQKGLIDNKQIEEMAKIAEEAIDNQTVGNCPFSPCPYKGSSICCDTCHTINALYNTDYRKQSEIELPCKVGDKVWCISNYTKPKEFQITILTMSENHYSFVIEADKGVYKHYCDKDSVGRYVFFTKEEAEKALAKMKGCE